MITKSDFRDETYDCLKLKRNNWKNLQHNFKSIIKVDGYITEKYM